MSSAETHGPAGGDERLRELALTTARREHYHHVDGIETLDKAGHEDVFHTCPHPDCALVRLPAERRQETCESRSPDGDGPKREARGPDAERALGTGVIRRNDAVQDA